MPEAPVSAKEGALAIMGEIVFKTLPQTFVPAHKLAELWIGAGLPKEYLPPRISALGAFGRAVEKIEQSQKALGGDVYLFGTYSCTRGETVHLDGIYYARVLLRSVTRNPQEIVYHIVRETVAHNDQSKRSLVHRTFGTLRWDRRLRKATFEWELTARGEDKIKAKVEELFWSTYKLHQTHYSSYHLRTMCDTLLRDQRIFKMASVQGCHFVPRKKAWISEGLRDFFEAIEPFAADPEYPPTCNPLPALKTENHRKWVSRSFLDHQKRLVEEVRGHLLGLHDLSEEQRAKAIERIKKRVLKTKEEVSELLEEYRVLLDAEFDIVERNVTLLTSVISELEGGRIPEL